MVSNIEVNEELIIITKYILNSVSEEGCWGTSDFSDWGPIITVLTVDHLFVCGMKVDDEWVVINGTNKYTCTIEKCLEYLNRQIHEDGSFGLDFWDTCKMASLIWKYKLQVHFNRYDNIEMYIRKYVAEGKLTLQNYDWCGPGVYAACAEFLFYINEKALASEIISKALLQKTAEGSFVGKKNRIGNYIIHPVWHTAQMLRIIVQDRNNYNQTLVDEITNWLCSIQSTDGNYEDFSQYSIYYTSYAVLGFLALPAPPQPHTDRSLRNILTTVSTIGKAGDSGGTIMVALALGTYLKSDASYIYEQIKIQRNKELFYENESLKAEIDALKQKVSDLENKYKDADIVLTKKDAFKWGILFALLGIIIPLALSLLH